MSAPFAMLGDPDAGLCVDGVCALPAEREPQEGPDAGTAASPEDEQSRREALV